MVIIFPDGSFALVECKLGGQEEVDEAAIKLKAIAEDVAQEKVGRHACSIILTKGNLAYRREDGVYVIPLATLRP